MLNHRTNRFFTILIFVLGTTIVVPKLGWPQCAMCKESLVSGSSDTATTEFQQTQVGGLGRGLHLSILFLIGMIGSVAGGVIVMIVREGRTMDVESGVSNPAEGGQPTA